MRAPRLGMIVLRVMLAQQVLAVVVAIRGAHDGVDMIAGGFVVRIDDAWLMVEFDEHDWTVDAVVEGAVVVVRANPGKVRVAQVIERLLEPDFRVRPGLFPVRKTGVSLEPILRAARDFLATLDLRQQRQVSFNTAANCAIRNTATTKSTATGE
jgi:hypothetical protein